MLHDKNTQSKRAFWPITFEATFFQAWGLHRKADNFI